ncbi:hypothetical protein ACFZBU_39125 [Embleya sp. NPDC008237]|uniref:hypothetical protein n=1 Tax=Embleya sp. NPDC008237 TaxID=3363978 RepID=UPI0036E79FE4
MSRRRPRLRPGAGRDLREHAAEQVRGRYAARPDIRMAMERGHEGGPTDLAREEARRMSARP